LPPAPLPPPFPYTTLFRSQHAAPVPARNLLTRALRLTVLAEFHEDGRQRHQLRAIGKVTRLEDLLPIKEACRLYEAFLDPISPGDRKSTRLNSSHVKISYA